MIYLKIIKMTCVIMLMILDLDMGDHLGKLSCDMVCNKASRVRGQEASI